MFAYAFPPISILTKVIGKLERDRCKILLIAPLLAAAARFPRLVRLLVGSPLILPDRHDLLVQPQSRFRHPSPGDLHLACWPLSSVPTEQQVFLKTLQLWLQRDVVSQQDESMTVDYDIISRLPVYFSHSPAGTSVQDMIHFAQMVSSGEFQMYDYGTKKRNMARYNQTTPPLYYPEKISVPVSLYWGGQDWLADPKDVELLIPRLRNLRESIYIPQYDHLDFIWGTDAPQWVYEPIIETIRAEESHGPISDENETVAEDEVENAEDESPSSVSEAIMEYYKKIEDMKLKMQAPDI
ncbi:uncharacterized protein LOC119735144 [Patiria miniata]|uniref:Uncharacterized protein n=1 Tax=Patiria miniata TaxID=46514 RepID=A0A914AMF4_PATMI|nr:uncharacterized protein LOC119735144 [Patiria miniata]